MPGKTLLQTAVLGLLYCWVCQELVVAAEVHEVALVRRLGRGDRVRDLTTSANAKVLRVLNATAACNNATLLRDREVRAAFVLFALAVEGQIGGTCEEGDVRLSRPI